LLQRLTDRGGAVKGIRLPARSDPLQGSGHTCRWLEGTHGSRGRGLARTKLLYVPPSPTRARKNFARRNAAARHVGDLRAELMHARGPAEKGRQRVPGFEVARSLGLDGD